MTTVEIKSGYGLDRETELKMLRVARRIGREGGVRVRTTYLGLHAVPPEHRDDRAAYVDLAIDDILPAAHAEGLVDAVDAYCEPIAFSIQEVSRLFDKACDLGLPVKLHADQLSNGGGAALWPRVIGRCRRTTSNTRAKRASSPWPPPAWSRSCCPAPI